MNKPVRQIAIVLYPGVTALDAVGPYELLKLIAGVDLRFVAHEPGPVVCDSGVLALGATHSFAETPRPDLVLVPGSEANTMQAMADGRLLSWLKQAHETTLYTTSVCSGALVLAAAGLLQGQEATTHWAAQSVLKSFGSDPQRQERIVRVGKIWTSAGVSAGIDMGLVLLAEIEGEERAEIAQLVIEYDPQPPFASGHPSKAEPAIFAKAKIEMARRAQNPMNALALPKIVWRKALDRMRAKAAKTARSRAKA
jgi:transcriptional regulator GlxA family with amidase domain